MGFYSLFYAKVMTLIEAIILGLIQGLTEFIPISSTAHLTIAGKMMGLIDPNNPEHWTAFIAIIQLGTIAAVFLYFAKEVKEVPVAFIQDNFINRKSYKQQSEYSRLGWLIIAGSVPVVLVGLSMKKIIEGNLTKDPIIIGSTLIILAIILYIAEKFAPLNREMNKLTMKDAWLTGIAQCFALIPGASRSGTTITAGLFLGMDRQTAAKFSFLLSIPAITGAGLLELKSAIGYMSPEDYLPLIIATLISGISGYASIAFLIKFLKNNSTLLFVNYRIIIGIIVLILANNGLL